MSIYHKIVLFLFLPAFVTAQHNLPDSLRQVLNNASNDSVRYFASKALYNYYEELNLDSALYYAGQDLLMARRNNKKLIEAFSLDIKGYQLVRLGRYSEALQSFFEAFRIAEDPQNSKEDSWQLSTTPSPGKSRLLTLALTHHMVGILMWQTQNTEQEIFHFKQARSIAIAIDNPLRELLANMNLGNSYLAINEPDSALFFVTEAERITLKQGLKKYLGQIYCILGEINMVKGDKTAARKYFYDGIESSIQQNNSSSLGRNYSRLIKYYLEQGEKDSSLKYSLKNLHTIESFGAVSGVEANIGVGYESVYISYKLNKQFDSAYKYQGLALIAKDSISKARIRNLAAFQNVSFREQLRLQNLEKEKVVYQNRIRAYAMLAGLIVVLIVTSILFRNNMQKRKANQVLEAALSNLKATQSQLIQSEKMASLGELTAGIAHEIQNPLNFVNNFSEVNSELINELRQEADSGNLNEVRMIAKDIKSNSDKITQHGKRAAAIVKGMLQHSQSRTGATESTNINLLVEEYFRLAYHGFVARDKDFMVTLKINTDKSIDNSNIIPQDIGRVLLNLYNNAFYAVAERQKEPGFEPMVTVTTKRVASEAYISVIDNGGGISQNIIAKIFQPFFTTKPTGQGTGLGLSLSYDIIKAHGGTIKVNTVQGEGSEFIIELPIE